MKSLFICFFLINFTIPSAIAQSELAETRELYHCVGINKCTVQEYEAFMQELSSNNPVVAGYQSMTFFFYANYYNNPAKKYKSFMQGKEALEKLIAENPEEIELRYLRLAIQDNAPGFLGYTDQIKEDESYINLRIDNIKDTDLKNVLIDYMARRKSPKN